MDLQLDGFEEWHMQKHQVPKEDSLLHAVSLAFFQPYINQSFNHISISRAQLVKNLKYELAEKLKKSQDYIEYLSLQLNKDIFILSKEGLSATIKDRNSIVLYDHGFHDSCCQYEMISVNGNTHFKPDHPFILFLKSK